MAKRPTARRGSARAEVDDLDDDDEYAWDAPKKRKKSTGKTKRSGSTRSSKGKRTSGKSKSLSSSTRGKSAKSNKASGSTKSGKSKSNSKSNKMSASSKTSGSARRKPTKSSASSSARSSKRASGESAGSGRRRRSAPPPRKKDNNTVVLVSICSITVILVIGVLAYRAASAPAPAQNDQAKLDRALQLKSEGMEAYRQWNNAKQSGDIQGEKAAWKTAHAKLTEAMDEFDALIRDPRYGDGTGTSFKPEYEGYDEEMSQIGTYLYDLGKGMRN